MAKKEVYVCDVCGTERKEANHWFTAWDSGVCDFNGMSAGYAIVIAKWGAHVGEDVKHLCGQACVHKFVDEYMSKPEPEPSRVEVGQ
jgi:hypothetical protein